LREAASSFVAVEVCDAQSSVALTSRHSEEIASSREAIQTANAVEIQNSAAAIEIRLSGGRSVMAVPGFDPQHLCAVIRAVESAGAASWA
jgi:hypothetical protein